MYRGTRIPQSIRPLFFLGSRTETENQIRVFQKNENPCGRSDIFWIRFRGAPRSTVLFPPQIGEQDIENENSGLDVKKIRGAPRSTVLFQVQKRPNEPQIAFYFEKPKVKPPFYLVRV